MVGFEPTSPRGTKGFLSPAPQGFKTFAITKLGDMSLIIYFFNLFIYPIRTCPVGSGSFPTKSLLIIQHLIKKWTKSL